MTTYIAAYDVEQDKCLEALPGIVALHEKYEMPGTFFIVARLLDGPRGAQYKALLGGNQNFELASHTYTHMLLRQVRLSPPPGPPQQYEHEIIESKRRIEDHFERPVRGFRMPWGSSQSMRGMPQLLALLDRGGYRYSSSLAWGPEDTLPALLKEAFTYAQDGYPQLWEIPPCGWHENVMKSDPGWGLKPVQLFPHPVPEANLSDYVHTPEEEFRIHRVFLDKAMTEGMRHVSLIWHPWSLLRFDPDMKMVEMVFKYVREQGLCARTFAGYLDTLL